MPPLKLGQASIALISLAIHKDKPMDSGLSGAPCRLLFCFDNQTRVSPLLIFEQAVHLVLLFFSKNCDPPPDPHEALTSNLPQWGGPAF